MEAWVERALARWPNVPALYGWLTLDRRGHWLIKGERISRPRIIDTINRNYGADSRGAWFFQNGPQRGYMTLEYAPYIFRLDGNGRLMTHTELPVCRVDAVYIDEEGAIVLVTEHGPGLISDLDLDWALSSLHIPSAGNGGQAAAQGSDATQAHDKEADAKEADALEQQLQHALEMASGEHTGMLFQFGTCEVPVQRLDSAVMPDVLGFIRQPQP